jgi:hypothetical protein
MNGEGYAVILVYSTSHAVRIEKLLAERGISCKMIPVPRQISSDCGVCVRILQACVAVAREAIEAAKIEIQGIASLEARWEVNHERGRAQSTPGQGGRA